jgi:glyoxylase-like metal-dependent hydrolase (beta-lactamase superfamily II)
MNYEILVLGMLQNNTYVLFDDTNKHAVVVDPTNSISPVIDLVRSRNASLSAILITHAHFDHIMGCEELKEAYPDAGIYLHKDDLHLWKNHGGADAFGFEIGPLPEPDHLLEKNITITIGEFSFQVFHTPGHTPGHVIYYSADDGVAFCGDLIFAGGVGRTDLPGGDFTQLYESIQNVIYTLPGDTILLPGHGEQTTVAQEKSSNPYV